MHWEKDEYENTVLVKGEQVKKDLGVSVISSVIDVMEKCCWQFSHHLLSNCLLGKIERSG